jgi:hypothetical protein
MKDNSYKCATLRETGIAFKDAKNSLDMKFKVNAGAQTSGRHRLE